MADEVKSSWSLTYVFLTITLSILTGFVGYGLKFIFEPEATRTLSVSEVTSGNLLSLDERASGGILASYKLRDVPDKELVSYFQHTIVIKNSGSVGVEDVELSVKTSYENVTLLNTPTVRTIPPEILQALVIEPKKKSQSANIDERTISLLNPGEVVELTYAAYSTESVDAIHFSSVVRKKDWEMVREGEKPRQQDRVFLTKQITEMTGEDIIVILGFFVAMQFSFNIYFGLLMRTPAVRRMFSRWREKE